MNCIETAAKTAEGAQSECVILMPLGLLGFEQFKRYTLHSTPGEEPFLWLLVVDEPKLAFLVISPFTILPSYRPELSAEDTRFLGVETPEDALVLSIVTLKGQQQATVNLKGPIVLNRRTLIAKQVVPLNAPDYPVAHPLPILAQ